MLRLTEDMPPCRKICTGRLLPTPLPTSTVTSACPAPAQLSCSCDDDESELSCDEDTCADAADCKQLHPEFCPHGLATDEDCTGCQPPAKPELTHLICPHCQSQIAMFDDLKQPLPPTNPSQARKTWPAQKPPVNTRSAPPPAPANAAADCAKNCPSKSMDDIKSQSSNSPMASCCGSSVLKLRSPHISQIKVIKGDDLECGPHPIPEPPDVAKSCCMSDSAIRAAPHMGRTSECDSITCGGTGPKSCSEMGEPPDPKGQTKKGAVMGKTSQPAPVECNVCTKAAAAGPPEKGCPIKSMAGQTDQNNQPRGASQPNQKSQPVARPTIGTSGKGKEAPDPGPPAPNPNCPRSGTATLFPAQPPPQPCLCRMPPAYTTGCTGNLSGNCNCTACNK